MVDITQWDKKQVASVGTLSDGSSFTGLAKVEPVKVTWGNSSTNSGSGDAAFTNDINTQDELVVTESDESTTIPYEVAYFDDTAQEAWLRVYGSWDSDGSNQAVIGCGGGDGTDYSKDGVGSNPHSQMTGWSPNWIHDFNNVDSDSSTTDTLLDSTSNGSNADAVGILDEQGMIGRAGRFDGVDDYGLVNNVVDVFSGAWTFSAWIKPEAGDTKDIISMGSGNTDSTRTGHVRLADTDTGASGDKLEFRYWTGSNVNRVVSNQSLNLDGSTWYHVVCVNDSSSQDMQIYIDGQIDINGSNDGDDPRDDGGSKMSIGAHREGTEAYFDGVIDEAKTYDGKPSSNQVLAEYDASPKGGQTFFSWSGEQDTVQDQPGSVRQTNNSGVVETTSSGVVKTNP